MFQKPATARHQHQQLSSLQTAVAGDKSESAESQGEAMSPAQPSPAQPSPAPLLTLMANFVWRKVFKKFRNIHRRGILTPIPY